MTATGMIRLASAAFLLATGAASAATYGELSNGAPAGGPQFAYPAGPYAVAPGAPACPPNCFAPTPIHGGPEGSPPMPLDLPGAATMPPMQTSARPFLPYGPTGDLPHGRLQLWTFSQVNSTTDPFNPWGLSTPFMFVPWSTPLSGWTNAQTWNWWRERSGALPRNW